MRKSNLIFIIAGAALAATSCEGIQATDPTEPYILSVDKASIEANGTDVATLTIKDANGLVLTDEEHIKECSFHILESDTYLTRKTNTFTTIDNGTYTIEGMYQGTKCQGTVEIKGVNRSEYEVFSKKVAIYRLTATWCQFCPSMTTALANLDNYTKDHTVVMAFHGDPNFGITENGNFLSDILMSQFATSATGDGYPFAIYSLVHGTSKRTRNDIMGFVRDELYNHPATSGIKATSTIKDGTVSISASVKVSADGKYDLGCAILQNGLSGGADAYEDVYNNVVRNISGNYRYMSTNAFTLKSGEEKTGLLYENIKFDAANKDKVSIVLFTLVADGNKVRIDNVVSMPVGGSVEYVYNE